MGLVKGLVGGLKTALIIDKNDLGSVLAGAKGGSVNKDIMMFDRGLALLNTEVIKTICLKWVDRMSGDKTPVPLAPPAQQGLRDSTGRPTPQQQPVPPSDTQRTATAFYELLIASLSSFDKKTNVEQLLEYFTTHKEKVVGGIELGVRTKLL